MGHGLTSTDGMLSVRETPWHGLGVVLNTAPSTMEEAFTIAGMDWEPVGFPVYARDENGIEHAIDGYKGFLRSDGKGSLSVMGEDYGAITHAQVGRVGNGFIAQPGVSIATLGSLHGGRQGFALFESVDGIEVPGDDSIVKGFLLLSWSHDGTRKFTARNTFIRVVCQNTLNLAVGSSVAHFTVKHTKGGPARMDTYAAVVESLAADGKALAEASAFLANTPFTRDDRRTLADAAFPLPVGDDGKVLDGIRTERALNAQDAFLGLFGGATVAGAMEGNAWGAYNALTETYDWLLGVEVNTDKRNLDAESTFLRTLGGGRDGVKADALSLVASIAGVSLPA